MSKREGHFMPTALLDSQFEALEDPSLNSEEAKRTITVGITTLLLIIHLHFFLMALDIDKTIDEIVNELNILINQKINP